ncbi:MAG TPA: shikimate kinase [Pyrinomonadaceae bacterium]|nr:shikimate kinase [Pyrinomonadaceae bacterium]
MIKQITAITGFMAAGKTSVARELAQRLNYSFVDLDAAIAAREARSVADIINTSGEDYFRATESAVLKEVVSENPNCVIALGGGAWTIEENRKILRTADAFVVWLDTPFDVCWQRILGGGEVRPLAQSREATEELYEERRALYLLADEHLSFDRAKDAADYAEAIASSVLK